SCHAVYEDISDKGVSNDIKSDFCNQTCTGFGENATKENIQNILAAYLNELHINPKLFFANNPSTYGEIGKCIDLNNLDKELVRSGYPSQKKSSRIPPTPKRKTSNERMEERKEKMRREQYQKEKAERRKKRDARKRRSRENSPERRSRENSPERRSRENSPGRRSDEGPRKRRPPPPQHKPNALPTCVFRGELWSKERIVTELTNLIKLGFDAYTSLSRNDNYSNGDINHLCMFLKQVFDEIDMYNYSNPNILIGMKNDILDAQAKGIVPYTTTLEELNNMDIIRVRVIHFKLDQYLKNTRQKQAQQEQEMKRRAEEIQRQREQEQEQEDAMRRRAEEIQRQREAQRSKEQKQQAQEDAMRRRAEEIRRQREQGNQSDRLKYIDIILNIISLGHFEVEKYLKLAQRQGILKVRPSKENLDKMSDDEIKSLLFHINLEYKQAKKR
ncbi:unnamed protein product, partial [marine sediment metagenome]